MTTAFRLKNDRGAHILFTYLRLSFFRLLASLSACSFDFDYSCGFYFGFFGLADDFTGKIIRISILRKGAFANIADAG